MRKLMRASLMLLALSASNAMAADHEVKMLNAGAGGTMVFEPAYLKIAAGDTVTFLATDPGHNAETVAGPAGSAPFNTAFKPKTTVTFDKEGVYLYKCMPHAIMGMMGLVQVGDASNKGDIEAAVMAQEATFVMNKGRLKDLFAQVQ